MPAATEQLFLPGWGAAARLYEPGLPAGWHGVDPPGFRRSQGSLAEATRWLIDELDRCSRPVVLAGHSMGGALAIAAAAARPDRVQRLVLLSPAGLPLTKPMRRSLTDFLSQAARGSYPLAETLGSILALVRAPASALRLARAVHDADLTPEMTAVRASAIEATVVACTTDTLVTTDHCRRAAVLLGARYNELAVDDGHMWMLERWELMAELLTASAL